MFNFAAFRKSTFPALAGLVLAFSGNVSPAANHDASPADGGLDVKMDAKQGGYQVVSRDPAWTFGGTLAAPLQHVKTSRGHDGLGDYRQTAFDWQSRQRPMSGWIRIYDGKPLALFSQTCGKASELPPAAFPDFTTLPDKLHVFSYGLHEFAPPHFSGVEISTPWLLFDDDANAFLISPATHFMVASMIGDGHKQVASGFNPDLRNVPAGFTQQTLVAFGKGINKTWDAWGKALVDLGGAKRPANDADATLKYLGYWTDNGAAYYYNYDFSKGYAGTLQGLVETYRQEEIPIRYLQLDSWWYYKTITNYDGVAGKPKKAGKLPAGEWNRYGGLLEYKAHTDLFPDGLAVFQKAVGLPLVTHNRWIDPSSPYHEKYKISGIAAVDPKWWDNIAGYCKASGIVTYEQDWLNYIYAYSPGFSHELGTAEAYLDNMARACKEQGVTVQYCMPLPCNFLQGSRYDNLTTIRTSGDRFNTNKWNDFLYTSRLASALGMWPWADVYMSGETNNVLLSTLSAGPVGIGDALGAENKVNLMQAVRADGMIVKPDAPIVPLDCSYIADAQKEKAPLVAGTYTDHNGIKTEYVFAFRRPKTAGDDVQFTPAMLGLSSPAYVYDYFAAHGQRLDAAAGFSAPLGTNANASAFYVVAPVGKSGIAFLGDKDKFVGTGKQRISMLQDERGKLTVGVVFAENEKTVTLHGYADSEPKLTILAGLDDPMQYNPVTHYFTVEVKPDASTPVDKSAADPVRRVTVLLETQPK
ncbi:MAG: hypothetical protein P4N60_23750 [Verrucomicrobiae bacterium]|nr:hypothetical protein [Verrucomicrobiae bacterium]